MRKAPLALGALMALAVVAGIVAYALLRGSSQAGQRAARHVGSDVPPGVADARRLGELPPEGRLSVQVLMPPSASLAPAEDFLRRSHLTVTDLPQVGLIVATGRVSAIEAVFRTRIDRWENIKTHESFYANDRPATFPFPVTGVFGLDDAAQPRPMACPSPCLFGSGQSGSGYTAAQLRRAYNADLPNIDGAGQRVAIYAGGGFDFSNIEKFDASNHLSDPKLNVNSFSVPLNLAILPPIVGPALPPTGDGAEAELELDIDAVHAIAPGAVIDVYEMVGGDETVETFMIEAALNREHILSISFGYCESDLGGNAPAHAALTDLLVHVFQMSIFAATGDTGRYCGDPSAGEDVNYPASDPWVTAVGGTHLDLVQNAGPATDSLNSEQAWDLPDVPWPSNGKPEASGGGPMGSQASFPRPAWQLDIGVPAGGQRMIPDVAAEADPGLQVYLGGNPTSATGTSLATPLWAGVAALYDQEAAAHGVPPLGFANPLLYKIVLGPERPLLDVTTVQNGGPDLAGAAGPGWDAATGLGSPNAAVLIQDGVREEINAAPQTATKLMTYNPWVTPPGARTPQPLPGAQIIAATGSCDVGSYDDPGRAAAYRCDYDIPNNTDLPLGVCFAQTVSRFPLLCSIDPTSLRFVELQPQPGSFLPVQQANKEDPTAPPWFLILADGHECHYAGNSPDSINLPYDCGNGLSATLPDRSQTRWTVQEAPFVAPTPLSATSPAIPEPPTVPPGAARVAVLAAIR